MPAGTVDGWFGKKGKLALGAAAGATAGSVAARGNVAPPQALGRLAKLFTVILLLINVPLAFMGGFGSWLITATHHQRHHDLYACNYGLYFRVWDRLCGTDRGLGDFTAKARA